MFSILRFLIFNEKIWQQLHYCQISSLGESLLGYFERQIFRDKLITLPASLVQLPTDKAAPIVVTCKSGHRGDITIMYPNFLGHTNICNLGGSMNAWIVAELPMVK